MNRPAVGQGSRTPPAVVRKLLHTLLLRGLRPQRLHHDPPLGSRRVAGQPVQALQVQGRRGQRLQAWLALPQDTDVNGPAPLAVALHGWGAHASTLWPVVEPLVRAGFAVVLFDAASHGDSSAEDFSSLPRFAEDLADVVQALGTQAGVDATRLVLIGHSVGAAAVLLHTATRGGVRAVVSLSSFAHPLDVMERWLRAHRIPRRWIGSAVLDHVQATIGHRFDHIAPVVVAPRIDCPVLLVHGDQDTTVPWLDALRLHRSLRRSELLVLPAGHDLRDALSPRTDRMVDFLRRSLADPHR